MDYDVNRGPFFTILAFAFEASAEIRTSACAEWSFPAKDAFIFQQAQFKRLEIK